MRIVLDLQGVQSSGSRNRGIGRYSLSLAQGLARTIGHHELLIALNGRFPETIDTVRTALADLLPQENIHVWQQPAPASYLDSSSTWRRKSAELLREAFLASLRPDLVHISSLFEGFIDSTVTSIGCFTQTVPTSMTLYDLIPLVHRSTYLADPIMEAWYETKLDHCRRASLWLAISEASRQEGIHYLGLPSEQVVTVSTAADPQFRQLTLTADNEAGIRLRYKLQRPFVMYTGGIDHRKNIDGLVRAFARLPVEVRRNYQLAVVCSIQPEHKRTLEILAENCGLTPQDLILTGFVPEEDLLALYNLCSLFVFPSWHEGFGLPALEAMACGAPVIGANCSSLPEVIGWNDALFDPLNDNAITEKLFQALTDEPFRASLAEHGLNQAQLFSWDAVAKRAIAGFEATCDTKTRVGTTSKTVALSRRPRLAYISPLPPERSGIAEYSAELLPELARYYAIEVIVHQDSVVDPWIQANCPIRSAVWFAENGRHYDRILYHFGNSMYHRHMFDLLKRHPGVVVLHDFFLSGVLSHLEMSCITPNVWAHELYHAHGYAALSRRWHTSDIGSVICEYPCNFSVLQQSSGMIVHSPYSLQLAQTWYGSSYTDDWQIIPLLRKPLQRIHPAMARERLGLPKDAFIVCSFGLVAPPKMNHRLLQAWEKSPLANQGNCKLIFVGEAGGEYGLQLQRACKTTDASITGWQDREQFRLYLSACDVAVQLRTTSRGETSAAALDCMNYGLATIINANGSLADLPSDIVWKLADDFDDAELTNALSTLYRDIKQRQELGMRAQAWIKTRHDPRSCSDRYALAIELAWNKTQKGTQALISQIAQGSAPSDEELRTLAQNIAASIPLKTSCKKLLIDISGLSTETVDGPLQSALRSLLARPAEGYRVEPVYTPSPGGMYYYARGYSLKLLACPDNLLPDEPVEIQAGDVLLNVQQSPDNLHQYADYYLSMQRLGAHYYFSVHDFARLLVVKSHTSLTNTLLDRWEKALSACPGLCPAYRPEPSHLPLFSQKHILEFLHVVLTTALKP
jgi:glycosyltransferase involved in cell wall biosynthesis